MQSSPPADVTAVTTMMDLIWGYRVTQALSVAARLGIADLLASGPMTADELAAACEGNPGTLVRLLRALTTIDVVHEDDDGRFAITPLGSLLGEHHPQSLRALALMQGAPHLRAAWGELHAAIVSGETAFERVHGMPLFDYLAAHPETGALFNRAMTALSRSDVGAVLAAVDLGDAHRVVDVGGGQGYLLRGVLERYPEARGILFDLPHVVAGARELRGTTEADRCEFVGGDMFDAVPAGGDVYLLKLILHDWDDAACLRLLRNVRSAIVSAGRLLVIDQVLRPSNVPDRGKWMDLQMLVMAGGRERTEEELRELFAQAGFTLTRVVPSGRTFVVEGVPA